MDILPVEEKFIKYIRDDENFMLTYGDGIGDIDIKELIKFHKSHGKLVTLTGVRPPGRFVLRASR